MHYTYENTFKAEYSDLEIENPKLQYQKSNPGPPA